MSDRWVTRQTLLQRAKNPDDAKAWNDFVKYYTDFIHVVLHQMSFRITEIDDVTQEILVRIWQHLSTFNGEKHKTKFRTWLSALIRNQAINAIKKNQRYETKREMATNLHEEKQIISQPELEKIVQLEWETHITTLALNNIKTLFTGVAIRAFELSLAGKSAKEIGGILDINPESVRTLKNRVKLRLIKEIEQLREDLEF
ncbi:RNA polymerase sigma factor [Pontiella sulfatireligans]|uniref:ECF RNA polymerase sigma factor SigW n=1 Tax=Pontiella sulfatireligans TaxID=2750658 RepID=A0A6C2UFI6_9BACT|nr:sigma-70 family RNA polymerase sigma factor [Pontiella sulfatireligans]VGO18930.1 ECF RNA polymerase sigma factor SigW [Pontiella sulfatireligans]